MPERFEQVGKANREVVVEGVEVLRVAYEKFLHNKQAGGYDFKFTDGQMIGHNFYKLILYHIAEESGLDKKLMLEIAISTLRRVIESPVTNEDDPELV